MSKSVIVKLRGGLGNQIFQFAFARYLQKYLEFDSIIIDTSYYNKKHIRNLELNKLSINDCEWTSKANIFFDFTYFIYRIIDRLMNHKQKDIFPLKIFNKGLFYCDKSIEIRDIKNIDKAFVAGYFQQEKVIKEVACELRNNLIPQNVLSDKAKTYYEDIKKNNTIAISIRIGKDYQKFDWPLCSVDFYKKGLARLVNDFPDSKIYVFSDCITKVKSEEWFKGWDVVFVESCSIEESLYLLSQCDNYVISNSTFSWIGSYLSKNPNRIIIAPEYFYKGLIMKSGELHIPNCVYQDNVTGDEKNI